MLIDCCIKQTATRVMVYKTGVDLRLAELSKVIGSAVARSGIKGIMINARV